MQPREVSTEWLTLDDVATLKGVHVSVVSAAIRNRTLNGVTTHPAHPWRWMVRQRDAEVWTPRIELPGQPVATTAEVSSDH